jgi:hypothetical protein
VRTAGALLMAMLVHAVETKRFVVAWKRYEDAVRALALGTVSDPRLGAPRFVSSARVPEPLLSDGRRFRTATVAVIAKLDTHPSC